MAKYKDLYIHKAEIKQESAAKELSLTYSLVPAKLHLFITIAKKLTPFLELFQTDKPMVPFLSRELENIMEILLQRFIKNRRRCNKCVKN